MNPLRKTINYSNPTVTRNVSKGVKPKILIFSTAYLPLIGGAEVAVKEITDRLPDYEFEMLTARLKRSLPKIEQVGRVKVRRVGWGTSLDKFYLMFQGGRIASQLEKQEKYSATWSIMASYGGFAALSFKKRHPRVPFLLTLQEGDDLKEIENKVRFFKPSFQAIFTQADYIQCISHYLADWARRMGAKAPVFVVPNGVDLGKFNLSSGLECQVPKEEREKIIITTSRLVKKNGVKDLIKSLAYLPANVKAWVLGTGPEEKNLKKFVKENSLEERVKFFGLVSNSELPGYLTCAHLFCRPSLSEGLGNSFLEAMALGLPVLGTPVGGIPDFLKEKETGFFCEAGNPASIAEKVSYIFDPLHQEEVEKVSEQGRQLVTEKYNWEIIAKDFQDLFSALLKV